MWMKSPKLTLVSPKIQSGDLFPALELVMSSNALSCPNDRISLEMIYPGLYYFHDSYQYKKTIFESVISH